MTDHMVVNTHLEIGVWGLLGGLICIHSVTFSLTECFSHQPDPRWSVFARSVWLLYTCCSFFFCFSLYKYEWISLNDSPLKVVYGQFAIEHPSCAFIMLQREGRRTKTQWAGGASSEVTHTMKCGLFGMMPRVFISFYSSSCWSFLCFLPTSHICILFGFTSTQFLIFQ